VDAAERIYGYAMNSEFRSIVFTGSSIIAMWENVADFFPGERVLNTAISGSQTADLLPELESLVLAHHPRTVCYYCGSNDINYAVPPLRIAENVARTYELLHEELPGLQFVYLSIIRAPQKTDGGLIDKVDEANALICKMAEQLPGFHFIDINPVFFTEDGEPRLDYYIEDRLHLTPAAYEGLGKYIAPRVLAL
jgi:lysophospholipase L1-like esterase